jgi:branched-subunit amino acid aminotransferase/4-amino-4-deoxychorismate lyase
MKLTHYLNGEFVTEDKLLISPRDLGFLRGYAVFDFFRTYNGHKPFMFDYHIDRLFHSAKTIGLKMPWTKKEVQSIILETLDKNDKWKEFVVRVVVSGGVATTPDLTGNPILIVILDEVIKFSKSIYTKGIKVSTISHKRYTPGSKTTHYVEAIQNIEKMYVEGSDELLYVFNNSVLEGAFSNFFCVVNNKLVTAENDILPGVTRKVVMEKLKLTIPVEARVLKFKELSAAKEAFITVSGKGIVPVVRVDDKTIGNGEVGPITKDLIRKFEDFIKSGKW